MSSTLSTANYAVPTHRYSASVDELTVPGTPTDPQMSRSSSNGSLTRVNRDDPECCPWCGKKVYFAEELKALKRKWHRMCFRCGRCKKTLEPGRFTEHDSTLYCQSCYNKQFGPRGYGYAAGLGSLLSTSDKRQQYTDTFTSYNGYEVQHHDPVEPIRGTQEWTESVFVDTTATPTGTGQPQFYSK
jgi:DNA-directed RNA polymerase subunit RPC12/RpoP